MKWPAAMLLLAVSIAPAYAQDTLVQQLYKQPDAVAASAGGVEDVTKRTQNARHFRNSGGAWTAVVATGLNYDDGKGGLLPVLPELWQTSSGGWQMQAGPLSVRSPETPPAMTCSTPIPARTASRTTSRVQCQT